LKISILNLLKKELGLKNNSNYETIIASLYYSNRNVRNRIIGKMSDETLKHFEILKNMINKVLEGNIYT
jgi:uncharacterized membrane protein